MQKKGYKERKEIVDIRVQIAKAVLDSSERVILLKGKIGMSLAGVRKREDVKCEMKMGMLQLTPQRQRGLVRDHREQLYTEKLQRDMRWVNSQTTQTTKMNH